MGSSESTLVKMPNRWKSHVAAQMCCLFIVSCYFCLFIVSCYFHCLWGFSVRSLFYFAVLCFLSSFETISPRYICCVLNVMPLFYRSLTLPPGAMGWSVESGWVVMWFLYGYTIRKNGRLLTTTRF